MKRWEITSESGIRNQESGIEDIISTLLKNRGLVKKKEIDEFLNPTLEDVTVERVGIDTTQLKKAITRIKKAIKNKEQIVVFGDYDVDGITGSAILWEGLRDLGANVTPYIPHRMDEGYGLSVKGISNIKYKISNIKLIITVDNGIVANAAVDFANKKNIDVIITDHHVPSTTAPNAHAIVHTTALCGAGVGWVLLQSIKYTVSSIKYNVNTDNHLELVALATIADLVPLVGANRTLTKYGLEKLRKTKRVGFLELFKEAALDPQTLGVYEVGHYIAPRLNAMGRLEYAMDSLRLLCTTNRERALKLAGLLGSTNKERQQLTQEAVLHAKAAIHGNKQELRKLLFIGHASYPQGVVGLVAGKLVEEFYRPSIVVSIGELHSKASARSVHGFNIIEFIRSASDHLVDAGGHPMAAGFTVETTKLAFLQKILEQKAEELLDEGQLTRVLRIDCEIPLDFITMQFFEELAQLAPFGMGNPEPVFVSRNVVIDDARVVGKEGKHVKLKFSIQHSAFRIEGIGFGLGERIKELKKGNTLDIAYTISKDTWNGNNKLQLKIKDVHLIDRH